MQPPRRPLAAAFLWALAAGAAAAQGAGPVRIGLSAPLTGPDAAVGQGMRAAAEQAVADLNRAAPAGGRTLALVVADDGGDARQGAAAARRLAAEGVRLVVGPLQSSVAAAAAPVYEEAGAVLVTPGAAWSSLTRRGQRGVFRLAASDAEQARTAAAYIADLHAGQRVAVVHDRTTFGRGLAEEVSRALKGLGLPEAAFDSLPRGARDAGEIAGRLKAAGIDVVYFGGLAPEAALLVRALRAAGLSAPMVASDGILDREFAALAGASGEGTVMSVPREPRRPPEPKADPRAGRPAARAPEAEAVAGPTYAAIEVLAQALQRARSAEPQAVAEALRGSPFRTVQGEVAFDAQGDQRGAVGLQVWRRTPDGRLDYAGNPP